MFNLAVLPAVSALDYLRDPELLLNTLLDNFGGWMVLAVALIVFIESGVLFPVLPGDSMIFTLGILHERIPGVAVWQTFLILFIAAILGNITGYWLGAVWGRKLFKDQAKYLSTANLKKTEEFFVRYGGPSLVLARFVPFIRTFVPIVTGIARFKYSTFLLWNSLGAALWVFLFLLAGSLLGGIPVIANNVELIAVAIVLVSVLPMVAAYFKSRRAKKTAADPQA